MARRAARWTRAWARRSRARRWEACIKRAFVDEIVVPFDGGTLDMSTTVKIAAKAAAPDPQEAQGIRRSRRRCCCRFRGHDLGVRSARTSADDEARGPLSAEQRPHPDHPRRRGRLRRSLRDRRRLRARCARRARGQGAGDPLGRTLDRARSERVLDLEPAVRRPDLPPRRAPRVRGHRPRSPAPASSPRASS